MSFKCLKFKLIKKEVVYSILMFTNYVETNK